MPGTLLPRPATEHPLPDAAWPGQPPVPVLPPALRSRVPRLAAALAVVVARLELPYSLVVASGHLTAGGSRR